MFARRALLIAFAALAVMPTAPSQAFEFQAYDEALVAKAIKSGKPVAVHVYASWCLQCHAQKANLAALEKDHQYDGVSFFRVDYDAQKDVVARLNCSRSTLIVYKGGKEAARMSWGVMESDVVNTLKAAL